MWRKKAGVSVASVSRYINKNGYVRSETGEKIAEVIKELNYVPNEVARSLFQKKIKNYRDITTGYCESLFSFISERDWESIKQKWLHDDAR